MSVYTTRDGDMVDRIAWSELGDVAHTAAILTANPGLVGLGPMLPAGLQLTLPDVTPNSAAEAPRRTTIRLWGRAS